MSQPITKLWFFKLKPGVTSSTPSYTKLLKETIAISVTASKRNHPSPKPHCVLYADDAEPSRALLVSGFPDEPSHKEAHDGYIASLLAPVFELVDHESEIASDVFVEEMPLEGEYLTYVVAPREIAGLKGKGAGGWDASERLPIGGQPLHGFEKAPWFWLAEGKDVGEVKGENVTVRVFKKVFGEEK